MAYSKVTRTTSRPCTLVFSWMLLLLAATACREGSTRETWRPESGARVADVPVDSVRGELRERLDADAPPHGLSAEGWRRVQALYASYDERPL